MLCHMDTNEMITCVSIQIRTLIWCTNYSLSNIILEDPCQGTQYETAKYFSMCGKYELKYLQKSYLNLFKSFKGD